MYKFNLLHPLLFIGILFLSSALFAQGPAIKDGKWQATLSEEMNNRLDEQIKMLDAMAKSDPSMQIIKDKVMQSLNEARQPKTHYLTEEQAERGVISFFDQAEKIAKESDSNVASCTHEIEWLETQVGSVSGKCEDGSIIKGEISVPNDLEIHYKATVTPVDNSPYPVGWDAKWVGSDDRDAN